MRYSEHRYWSVMENTKVARLSIADQHGAEHFAIVAIDAPGQAWRERRDVTLNAIADHIEEGQAPGQVFAEMTTLHRPEPDCAPQYAKNWL